MILDDRDRRLLQVLQEDSRTPVANLANMLGMSTSSCWRRIRMFEDEGIITGYGIQLDPMKMGLAFHAVVHVQLTRHDPSHLQEFIRAVEGRDEVIECFATTGTADYHLRVMCADIAAYNELLESFLFRLPAVRSAQTNVILRAVKQGRATPAM